MFNALGFASVLLISIFLISPLAAANDQILTFSASVKMPFSNDENTGFEDRILSELFCRLGYKVRVHFVEAERALHELSAGSDDGALGRVHGVTAIYPGILEIPEQAFVREFVTYTKPSLKLDPGWSGLSGKTIGYVRGWKIVENNVPDDAQKIVVPTGSQLFKMLDKGRIDVAIFNKWGGLQELKNLEMTEFKFHEPPLARAPHHFVLHKSHADLIEPAAQALRAMKKDGTYQRIFEETLAPLDPANEGARALYGGKNILETAAGDTAQEFCTL